MPHNVVGELSISSDFRCGLVEADDDLSVAVSKIVAEIDGEKHTHLGAVGLLVSDDATSYVFLNSSGEITVNDTGWPVGTHIRLARVVASGGVITAILDARPWFTAVSTAGPGGVADSLKFSGDCSVPANGASLFLGIGGVPSSSAPAVALFDGTVGRASVSVDQVDVSRAYSIRVWVEGSVADSLTLPINNTSATDTLSAEVLQGETIAVEIKRDSGPVAKSSFRRVVVSLEIRG